MPIRCPDCGASIELEAVGAAKTNKVPAARAHMGLTGFQLALVFAALLLGLIGAHLEYHGRVLGGQFSLFGWSMGLAGAGRALNLVSFLVLAYFGLKSMRMKRRIDRGNSGPRLRA